MHERLFSGFFLLAHFLTDLCPSCHAGQDFDEFPWAFFNCIAETERQGTDHLDLAGLPQRSQNSDSTHTLSTTPDSKKKSKGIKKIFGK